MRFRVRLCFTAVLFASLAAGQRLAVYPTTALLDQPVSIVASELRPGERVAVRANLIDGDGHAWRSEAEFIADDQGRVDLATQAPVKGSYRIPSGMGLVWSMKPEEKTVNIYRPPHNLGTQTINFELTAAAGSAIAQLHQEAVGSDVRHTKVTGQLHGTLFAPGDNQRHPAVLVLGGSEGGLPARRAAWLASHGYTAFALAYFRYENLPPELRAIPLEYFGEALGWLMKRPEVVPEQLAVMGTSRGGELALQLASMYPQLKAVVAYVGANFRHGACCGGNIVRYAWTWNGAPLAFASMMNGPDILQAHIAVERIQGPILFIAGADDHVWDSTGMARQAAARLKSAKFPYAVEEMIYPHAGHIAGRPEIVPEWHGQLRHPVSGRPMDYGGTPEGNALSSLDAIPKVLHFLETSLR